MTAERRTLMDLAYEERSDLARYLATLTPQQWDAPSLCAGWTIKDVVAHIVSYEDLRFWGLLRRFAKGRVVRANEVGVEEFARMTPDELMGFLNEHLRPRGLTAAFGGMIGLVDGTIHHQDIRRALGHPRAVPADRLTRILPLIPSNPRLGAGRRIRGLRLRAVDVDWQHGTGPEVVGTGEALLMAMSGRRQVIGELEGDGAEILAERLRD
ncbi:maleylpyruvate isomerase family mycothiol-dependent enzyme [Mycolicibacterium goodii]|uniref:DinB family protein n=1 Tax=Mycolicibacterium goodii TaxID=134601 RepID=A0A0K0X571_MYCGD|nr:DinB family protein [Mycolicibacterium goodii]